MRRGEKVKDILKQGGPRSGVVLSGWVRSVRDSKQVAFVMVNDGSCLESLQVVMDAALPSHADVVKAGTGAAVRVTGDLVPSQGGGQQWELKASCIEVVGSSDPSYPLQKKRHTFEFLRTIAHLRVRSNVFGAVFRVRNAASHAIHRFFQERGFLWVHTPIITGSDCEGAGEMFQVTTLELGNPPRTEEGKIDFAQDFFARQTSLTVSGQLEAETFALAFGDVYTFGPTFRAENSNTPRHASEFWMIEPEMAFFDLQDNVALATDFIKYMTAFVLEQCGGDIDFLEQWVEKGLRARLEQVVSSQFSVMTYTEAVERLAASGEKFEYPVKWGIDLQTEHERHLTEVLVKGPVFVIDYPKDIKAFYMKVNDDGRTVAAMDLLVPRIGEIIGGSQREHRLDVLLERIRGLGLREEDYWWYLDTRRFGTCPHAGFGLGFERAVMYLTGMSNIRDVIPYPRVPGTAEF
ncbi:MAG: asparagine--tRNA ligase [Deltaproteobacteria bacterium]|nr:asparagine--tRNA ligase [Deltaproteobacteria bacterium]